MKPIGWISLILFCIVGFCWAILPLTRSAAMLLMLFFGLDDAAVPVGFVIAGAFLVVCILRGIRDGMK